MQAQAAPPAPRTCQQGGICQVGDTGPGGGIVFYVAPIMFTQLAASGSMCTTNCKYLEAAPSSWNGGGEPSRSWATNTNNNRTTSVPAPGAMQTAIGAGYQNSVAIVAQTGNEPDTSAAVVARAYAGGGKNDWYLPSKDELNQLYSQKTTVGVFENGVYWSSSEYSASHAWLQSFVNGSLGDINKSWPDSFSHSYVRPIRAFADSFTISLTQSANATIYEPGPDADIFFESETITVAAESTKTLCIRIDPGYVIDELKVDEVAVEGEDLSDVILGQFPYNLNCVTFEDIDVDHSFSVRTIRTNLIDSMLFLGEVEGFLFSDPVMQFIFDFRDYDQNAIGGFYLSGPIVDEWCNSNFNEFCTEDGEAIVLGALLVFGLCIFGGPELVQVGYTPNSPEYGLPQGFVLCHLPYDGSNYILESADFLIPIDPTSLGNGVEEVSTLNEIVFTLSGGDVIATGGDDESADIEITSPLAFTIGGTDNPSLGLLYRYAIYEVDNAELPLDVPVFEGTTYVIQGANPEILSALWDSRDSLKDYVVKVFLETVNYQFSTEPLFTSAPFKIVASATKPSAPVAIYVPPIPIPFLNTLTLPKIHRSESKLVCNPGTYQSGQTLDGVVQTNSLTTYLPSIFTYNLLLNGTAVTALSQTSTVNSASWDISNAPSGTIASCSVVVTRGAITNVDRSTDNASAVSSALSTQTTSIATANADYSALLSANSKSYQKALVDNRTKWRSDTEKIRTDYYAERDRIKSLPSTKTTRALSSAALKAYSAAIKKAAADYKASQPAALAVRDAANKTALAARDEAISKANTTYGTFIESIGYGVLIP